MHTDSCPNNELTITVSVNSTKSTADNNAPSTHTDIQTPLTTKDNLSGLTKHSDKAFMKMEAKFSALKGYTDCETSFLNSKVDQFIESLKETITKKENQHRKWQYRNSSGKYLFSTEGALSKEQLNIVPDGNSDIFIRGYN